MFDFSFAELLVVMVVALLVLGPKQLPVVANRIGNYLRYLRNFAASVQADIKQQILQEQLKENEKRAKLIEDENR